MAKEVKKEWWQSKTLWVNVLALLGALFTNLAGMLDAGVALSGLAVANLVLRLVTKQGLKF